MQRITIGIDPDTKTTGIGVLLNGKPEFAVTAEATERLAYNRVESMGYALHCALQSVRIHLGIMNFRAEIEIAIEWQALRPDDLSTGLGKCNRIMNLMAVAGMAYQAARHVFPTATIKHVYPCDWKGTIPKKIHQARLRAKLAGEPLNRWEKQLGKTKFSHVLDGLGLALALHGRKV